MSLGADTDPVLRWWDVEPVRLQHDLDDVAAIAPDLHYQGDGRWAGQLPRWPFRRPEPSGLRALLPTGLEVLVETAAAHPLVEPAVHPLDVDLEIIRRLDHRWHLGGDGRLCLLQSPLAWRPADRISELLLKAAGWWCELALLQVGVTERMSEAGIVSDASRDHLFGYAAQLAGETW